MSRKTLGRCELLLLGMVGLFTALPYAEAEPLISGAFREVTVTATIPEYAEASLGGDIVVVGPGPLYKGITSLTVKANFTYNLAGHWLQGSVWDPDYQTIVSLSDDEATTGGDHDLVGTHDPGVLLGYVHVYGYGWSTDPPEPVGTDAGAFTSETADVYDPEGAWVGKVQVTVSHQP
jgi:hypothetical protein